MKEKEENNQKQFRMQKQEKETELLQARTEIPRKRSPNETDKQRKKTKGT